MLAIFIVSFFILGYLGTIPPSPNATALAQICTVLYFAYFALMPWYTRVERTKPEPDRVTMRWLLARCAALFLVLRFAAKTGKWSR
jgi:ubiquinol-cytochrome c reductase cytochrome b subunit